MSDAPAARPADRYGDLRPSWHRTAARTLAALVALAGLVWVVWVGLGVADREVRWQDVGFTLDTADTDGAPAVEVVFDVTVYEGTSATCTIRALSASYAVVGQVDVPVEVEPGRRTVRERATVLVTEPAVSGGVEGCRVP